MRRSQRSDLPLPEEIMEEILLSVDVKSLLRCRCVSKSYRSLIDSKRFIKLHLQRSTRDASFAHHRVLFFNDTKSPKSKFSGCSLLSFLDPSSYKEAADLELNSPEAQALLSFIDPSSYKAASELNFPLLSCIGSSSFETASQLNFPTNIPPYSAISWLGCCNGLVCILLRRNKSIGSQFVLWNPSTRIFKEVPCIDKSKICKCYGFGWDESSDDYKIVAIVKVEGQSQTIFKIYSLKSDKWKQNDGCDGLRLTWYPWDNVGVFTTGKLYWECYNRTESHSEIVAFDLKREVFHMIEQPFPSGDDCYMFIGTFGECLAVQHTRDDYEYIELWVMKEFGVKESWEKVMVLEECGISPSVAASYINDGIGIGKGGEVIFMNLDYNVTYLAYNEKKKCLYYATSFKDYSADSETDIHSQIYVESLVSPLG